jgi:excisionase family DNA binding protein
MEGTITIGIDDLKELICSEVHKVISKLNLVPKDQDVIFNLEQACAYLNLKPATIYDLNYHNKIPTLKRGKKLSFSKKMLDEWNEAGRPANEEKVSLVNNDGLKRARIKRLLG